jgi:hypothetical protein
VLGVNVVSNKLAAVSTCDHVAEYERIVWASGLATTPAHVFLTKDSLS